MGRRKPVDAARFGLLRQPRPLYEQLAELIRQKVAAGELGPGERLPGELELSSSLGVSRPSVREALKILRALGVVSIRHGDGVYVTCADAAEIVRRLTPAPVLPPEGLYHVYEVRKVLECQAAAWAAQRASAAEIAGLGEVVGQMKGLVEDPAVGASGPPLDRLEELDTTFHHRLTMSTGNGVLMGIMDGMMEMIRESRRYSLSIPGRAIQSVYDHERIFEAVAARKPVAAARAMFAHIDGVQRCVFRVHVRGPGAGVPPDEGAERQGGTVGDALLVLSVRGAGGPGGTAEGK
ncbi:MAG: FadR/GntR family transcriptional regulator [Bacillota bacterium]|nr:FadR/GntR family transcriptional regulator [Bacillota bacterium]